MRAANKDADTSTFDHVMDEIAEFWVDEDNDEDRDVQTRQSPSDGNHYHNLMSGQNLRLILPVSLQQFE